MKLNEILIASFGGNEDQLTDSCTLHSLPEWDSMSHMLFITKLEEAFNIELTGNEIASIQTVGDIKKIIDSKTFKRV